jgi:hypothetical protein
VPVTQGHLVVLGSEGRKERTRGRVFSPTALLVGLSVVEDLGLMVLDD